MASGPSDNTEICLDTMEIQLEQSDESRAEEIKLLGNVALRADKLTEAFDLYTKAIELNSRNAVFWANRAIIYLKRCEYAAGIPDVTKAIELDPKYITAYIRRATLYESIGKFQEAHEDFLMVERLNADSRDPDIHFVADTIDFRSIDVEPQYSGPRIEGDIVTLEFVMKMMDHFKNQKLLHQKYAFQIILEARDLLRALPSLVDISIPNSGHVTICGDIHGQFYDLMHIFELNGLPSKDNPYLFNGDYVDRGSFSLEVILTLFAFKCMSPSAIYLSRGNHESKSMFEIYGFAGEVKSKLNETFVELFAEVFCCLPLAHVINEKVFVVHGGLCHIDGVKLSDIRGINRFCEPPEAGLMCELLWNDPQQKLGMQYSSRGTGVCFGEDVTKRFLSENNLDLVVRSHQLKEEGYEIEHDGKLITLFSAPNYCDEKGNKGAFMRLEAPDLKPNIVTFSAAPHPPVDAMLYADMEKIKERKSKLSKGRTKKHRGKKNRRRASLQRSKRGKFLVSFMKKFGCFISVYCIASAFSHLLEKSPIPKS